MENGFSRLLWKSALFGLISILSVDHVSLAQESGVDLPKIVTANNKVAEALNTFRARGSFNIRRGTGKAAGTFDLLVSGESFSFKLKFARYSGFEHGLYHFRTRYHVVGDGDRIVVVRFSPDLSKGCDGDVFEANSRGYKDACPYTPIEPHLASQNFILPDWVLNSLTKAKLIDGQLKGAVALENGGGRIEYELDRKSNYCLKSCCLNGANGESPTYRLERVYKPNTVMPVISREWKWDSDGRVSENTLRLGEFEYEPEIAKDEFTLAAIDFCQEARLVDRTGDVDRVLHGLGNAEIRKSLGRPISKVLEELSSSDDD